MSDYRIPDDTVVHDDPIAFNSLPWSLPPETWQPIWDAGIDGLGVVIGNGDTGVVNHADLPKPVQAKDFTNSSSGVADRNGHGTHTIGTNCGLNGIGVAPKADLVVAKVLGDSGSGSTTGIDSGVRWMADMADVISLSLGGGSPTQSSIDAIKYAESRGAVVVAAAGNSGFNGSKNTIGYPGKYLETICVGATRMDKSIAGFSSGGREIDIAAPGEQIISANYKGGRVAMSGTSMATPFAAGCIALLIQVMRRLGKPDLTGAEAWRLWLQSSDFVKDAGQPGHDHRFGYGIIDITQIVGWLRKQSTKWICWLVMAMCVSSVNAQGIMSLLTEAQSAKVTTEPVKAFAAPKESISVESVGDKSIVFVTGDADIEQGVLIGVETEYKNNRVKLIRGEFDEQDLPKLQNGKYVLLDKPGKYGVRVGLWDADKGFDWLTVPVVIGGQVDPDVPETDFGNIIKAAQTHVAVNDPATSANLAKAYQAILWPDDLENARKVVSEATALAMANRPKPRKDWSGWLATVDAEIEKVKPDYQTYKRIISEIASALSGVGLGEVSRIGGFKKSSVPVVADAAPPRMVTEPRMAFIPIVRRAKGNWTDPDVGAWSATTLTLHLKGELESPQHRGLVPAGQLVGRSLRELRDIHDNLHEGFAWDGTIKQSLQVGTNTGVNLLPTIRSSLTVQNVGRFPQVQTNSQCPPGGCPTNAPRRRLFGR